MAGKWMALFPGQGSQHVGMAKDLYENFAVARETFEEASDATSRNLKKLCFDGPESDLTLTENTQPCLLTASVAAFRAAQAATGFRPDVVAGHSLGEYSALVAAGALPLATAARWVRERGAAMQKAVPAGQGTMAAVMGLEDGQVELLCARATEDARRKRSTGTVSPTGEELTVESVVQPANFNSPGQVVIAGSTDAVAEAIALIKEGGDFAGGKAIPLSVSAPFHCKLMRPARERMAELFAQARAGEKPSALQAAYVPNRTGRITREPGLVLEMLVEQVDHPVLWKQSMRALLENGYAQGAEFGPGAVLQGLAKRIAKQAEKPCVVQGVSDKNTIAALEKSLAAPAGGAP
jgi:[acyl-carrier-protein] S-malonyltransferase